MSGAVKNIIIVVAVVALVAVVAVLKTRDADPTTSEDASGLIAARSTDADVAEVEDDKDAFLPRMIDLGSTTCIPCKKMAPILAELEKHYEGRAEIEFIDVKRTPKAYSLFGITAIPTQIFFDRDDEEVWRHKGFLSREEIMAKFRELGVE